jgi:hypothetical protein
LGGGHVRTRMGFTPFLDQCAGFARLGGTRSNGRRVESRGLFPLALTAPLSLIPHRAHVLKIAPLCHVRVWGLKTTKFEHFGLRALGLLPFGALGWLNGPASGSTVHVGCCRSAFLRISRWPPRPTRKHGPQGSLNRGAMRQGGNTTAKTPSRGKSRDRGREVCCVYRLGGRLDADLQPSFFLLAFRWCVCVCVCVCMCVLGTSSSTSSPSHQEFVQTFYYLGDFFSDLRGAGTSSVFVSVPPCWCCCVRCMVHCTQ